MVNIIHKLTDYHISLHIAACLFGSQFAGDLQPTPKALSDLQYVRLPSVTKTHEPDPSFPILIPQHEVISQP